MTARFVQHFGAFEQLVIVDIEDSRGHLRALEHASRLHEVPALIARQSCIADSVEPVAATLYGIAEAREVFVGVAQFQDLVIETVDVFPEFARNAVADGAGVFARLHDALAYRVGVVFGESEEVERALGAGLFVYLVESRAFARRS